MLSSSLLGSYASDSSRSQIAVAHTGGVSWPNVHGQRNYNKPTGERGQGASTPGTDRPMSDHSKNSGADASMHDPLVPHSVVPQVVPMVAEHPKIEVPRIEATAHDQASSRVSNRDDDSYFIPQHSVSSAPRMLQQSQNGRPSGPNAFRRLRHMGSASDGNERLPALPPPGDLGPNGYPNCKPGTKKSQKKYPYSKDYHMRRCTCCATTFFMAFMAALAVATLVYALTQLGSKCKGIVVTLVVMDVNAIVIIIIEWIRLWLWREPSVLNRSGKFRPARGGQLDMNTVTSAPSVGPSHPGGMGLPPMAAHPTPITGASAQMANCRALENGDDAYTGGFLSAGFQPRLYDMSQFISGLVLIVLYISLAAWVLITIAMAINRLEQCDKLPVFALGFSILLAALICLRLVFCCISDACHGLCYRAAVAKTGSAEGQVPIVSVNQLHDHLPGLGRQLNIEGAREGSERTAAWLATLSTSSDPAHQLSIIQPMPAKFSSEVSH